MVNTSMSYLLLFAVDVTGAVAEISVYKWGTSRQFSWLIGSYLLCLICITLLGIFFRVGRFSFGPAIIMALAVHGLSCLACDYFQFGNRMNQFEMAGIAFAAFSMILFEVGRTPASQEDGKHHQHAEDRSRSPSHSLQPSALDKTPQTDPKDSAPTFRRAPQPVVSFTEAAELSAVHGTPIIAFSRSQLQQNLARMRASLPCVEMFYAAKANPEPAILRALFEAGCSVDVCSYREMQAALDAGFRPEQMIHTHPCKRIDNLVNCYQAGLKWFTFDAPGEIAKFVQHAPDAKLILRLAAISKSSLINLSAKFGCPPAEATKLMKQALAAGLQVKALSFHVGSQCVDPADFLAMLQPARKVWDAGLQFGCPLEVLDIGGGFPAPYTSELISLEEYCEILQQALADTFGDLQNSIRVIAEPGRGLVAECATLIVRVIGQSNRGAMTQYVIDDGLYGAFSGMVYDQALFLLCAENAEQRPRHTCIVAGPTCDSCDIVSHNQVLPQLKIGELLLVPTMGAYSSASASGFNGLDLPRYVEIE